jgi:hypothetical protein
MSISTYKKMMTEGYLYEASQDDEDYVHIGYGKYKDKDHVDDPTAPTFKKDDSGAFVSAKGADKEKPKGDGEKPKAEPKKTAISKTGGFGGDTGTDADYDYETGEFTGDDEFALSGTDTDDPAGGRGDAWMHGDPPEGTREPDDTAGDPEDAWDDEEGRAKPTGKTDADAWEDDPVGGDDVDDEEPEDDEPTIKESVNKRIAVKEVYKWLKGLEEYRYRKIPNVDVRRITSFVNNGLSEIDLPKSLQKKWESAKYSKEKNLADRFVKQKISQKLTQTESKHPLKEQYDRLFTDRTVL